MALFDAKAAGVIAIVLLGMLLVGCVSGGQGAAPTASPSGNAEATSLPTISDDELNLPDLGEDSGLDGSLG
ncbi:MAG: hypothetical protein QXR53_02205 [Candidatus Norongarragalinales archaeon]